MVIDFPFSLFSIHHSTGIDNFVFQGRHQIYQFKGRTGLMGFSNGIIKTLVILTVYSPAQVGYRLHFTRFGLHDDYRAMVRLVLFKLLQKCMVRNILNVDINGRINVIAILRLHYIVIANGLPLVFCNFHLGSFALYPTKILAKCAFHTYPGTVSIIINPFVTHTSFRNFSQRMLPTGTLFNDNTSFKRSFFKQGKTFHGHIL